MGKEEINNFESNTDASGLMNSIRDDSAQKIDNIKKQADVDIKMLKDNFNTEMEEFKRKLFEQTDIEIDNELTKIQNSATIEKTKLKLNVIESFIESILENALNELKTEEEEKYRSFLLKAIIESMSQVVGKSATIHLTKDDIRFEKEIMNTIKSNGRSKAKISISNNETIKDGGAVVIDDDTGLSYNSTLERIIYRKYDKIRKHVVDILMER